MFDNGDEEGGKRATTISMILSWISLAVGLLSCLILTPVVIIIIVNSI